ncbi:hypothetical protein Taro_054767 [Colocasia esculenta]|uniref:Uncharacterized protein n=1 Tax=Colocasia esculenta TaxID=4460 RepID=A0A843XRG5_COLES|nr:hypothetical protein [Colocasia esculenta]
MDYWFMKPVSNPDNTTQELALSPAAIDSDDNSPRERGCLGRRQDLDSTTVSGQAPSTHTCLAHTEPGTPN